MEHKFVTLSWEQLEGLMDVLGLEVETSEGRDGFIYGNYVDFPSASIMDDETLDAVLSVFTQEGADLARDEKIDLVDRLLPDTFEEQDLPDKYKFWNSADFGADEFEFPPSAVSNLVAEIEEIREAFLLSREKLVRKGLAVAAFALLEAHGKAIFKNNPAVIFDDPNLSKYVNERIALESDTLRHWSAILRALGRDGAPANVPGYDLRNALSHEFAAVELEGELFRFKTKNDKPATRTVRAYFDGLCHYAKTYLDFPS